jgi:hypothetical protein
MGKKGIEVDGLNKCYSVEIKETEKGISIALKRIDGQEMCVVIGDDNWKQIKERV